MEISELPQADLKVLQPERVTVVKSGTTVETPPLAVYWRGVPYSLPVSTPITSPAALADELRWLFQTLGCDETGRAIKMP